MVSLRPSSVVLVLGFQPSRSSPRGAQGMTRGLLVANFLARADPGPGCPSWPGCGRGYGPSASAGDASARDTTIAAGHRRL
jgi:hypothetical protein